MVEKIKVMPEEIIGAYRPLAPNADIPPNLQEYIISLENIRLFPVRIAKKLPKEVQVELFSANQSPNIKPSSQTIDSMTPPIKTSPSKPATPWSRRSREKGRPVGPGRYSRRRT